jgi:hypothetical protein
MGEYLLFQNLGLLMAERGCEMNVCEWWHSHVQGEAVVNPGPAIFISPAGPNPIMVQVSRISCFLNLHANLTFPVTASGYRNSAYWLMYDIDLYPLPVSVDVL